MAAGDAGPGHGLRHLLLEAVPLRLGRRHPGEHTLVSRATDAEGRVQPTAAELEYKQTGLENHQQFPRTVRIA